MALIPVVRNCSANAILDQLRRRMLISNPTRSRPIYYYCLFIIIIFVGKIRTEKFISVDVYLRATIKLFVCTNKTIFVIRVLVKLISRKKSRAPK